MTELLILLYEVRHKLEFVHTVAVFAGQFWYLLKSISCTVKFQALMAIL
jgi:hypothetical protein